MKVKVSLRNVYLLSKSQSFWVMRTGLIIIRLRKCKIDAFFKCFAKIKVTSIVNNCYCLDYSEWSGTRNTNQNSKRYLISFICFLKNSALLNLTKKYKTSGLQKICSNYSSTFILDQILTLCLSYFFTKEYMN